MRSDDFFFVCFDVGTEVIAKNVQVCSNLCVLQFVYIS